MPPIYRTRSFLVGLGVVVVAMGGVGFLPLFGGPGYESSLGAGIVLGLVVSVTAAVGTSSLEATGDEAVSPLDVLSRGMCVGGIFALAAWVTTLLHGLRVGFCDVLTGSESFAIGPAVGALLAGTWGALAGEIARGRKRRRLVAVSLGLAGPLGTILFSVGRFYTSPMIFAYDPFVGYFSGTLYDTLIDFSGLLTYRAGTAATLVAAVVVALHLERNADGKLRPRWIKRPEVAVLGLAAASASVLANAYGSHLGHWQTSGTIATILGGRTEGLRCTVVHPRTLRRDDVERFMRDCDAHVQVLERWFGAPGPARITAFLFESSAQKGALMGAADTFIAKPWRKEIYVQSAPYPHPVVGHELAHVLAGSFGQGPFKVAGSLSGLLPNPGLIEGVAVAAEPPEGDLLPREWAKAMKDLDLLPPLDHLFTLGFLGENASVAYTVSGAFVGWIHERFGADAVRAWYGGRSLPEVTGASWADLERRFHEALDAVDLPETARGVAKARFDRPAIFGRRCPHVVDACRARGDGLRGAGDYEGAIEAYEELLALDPHDDGTRISIARARLRERGRGDEGAAMLSKLADEPKVRRHVRDRAIEDLADRALLDGRSEEALARYGDVASRTLDEDARRTLDIKMDAAKDEALRPGIIALLIGQNGRGPDRGMAMELLRELVATAGPAQKDGASMPAHAEDGLPWYLLARQYANGSQFDEASVRLDRALASPIALRRVRVEAERLRMLTACATGDAVTAAREYDLLRRASGGERVTPRRRPLARGALHRDPSGRREPPPVGSVKDGATEGVNLPSFRADSRGRGAPPSSVIRQGVAFALGASLLEPDIRSLEPILLRFALRATRDPEASKDLAQEALLAAFAQAESFGGKSSLRTWVIGILAHKVTDHLRHTASRRAEGDDDPDLLATPSTEDVERVVMARQELSAVDRALRSLPDKERLALLLVDVEGAERDEACNALGVSATHLRVLLHRARNRLRRILEDGHQKP